MAIDASNVQTKYSDDSSGMASGLWPCGVNEYYDGAQCARCYCADTCMGAGSSYCTLTSDEVGPISARLYVTDPHVPYHFLNQQLNSLETFSTDGTPFTDNDQVKPS